MTVGKQLPEQPVPPLSIININMCTGLWLLLSVYTRLKGPESCRPAEGKPERGSVVRDTGGKGGKGQEVAKRQLQAEPWD